MDVVLFEDDQCQQLYPLGLFTPLFDIQVGSMTLRSMLETTDCQIATVIRDHFLFGGEQNPPINKNRKGPLLFLNASIEPDLRALDKIVDLCTSGDPFVTTSGNRVAAALVAPDTELPERMTPRDAGQTLLELHLPLEHELFGTIDLPHEVVQSHLRISGTNIDRIVSRSGYREQAPGLFVGDSVDLAPTVAIETGKGPVVLDSGVKVMHFSYLEGPIHVGENSLVIEHSSIKDYTSIGRRCKVGGEVETSNISMFSNKQHHGFLGHSWVGNWVNLGAGTSSSDLKNTYGTVRVDYENTRFETGMQFLGTVIGDFAKTAVNTSIFTGKIVGVCSMIYGTVTTNVPSFSNYARSFGQVTEFSLAHVKTTQKRVFARRDIEQTERDTTLMARVFDMTRHERAMSEEQINF